MSWMQKYLAPFRDQADGTADDPLGSEVGAGEQLHPDQDNTGNPPIVPSITDDREVLAVDGMMIRAAARAVYTSHPHAHAAADRIATAMESGTAAELTLTDFERSVVNNCLTHLTRS